MEQTVYGDSPPPPAGAEPVLDAVCRAAGPRRAVLLERDGSTWRAWIMGDLRSAR